jgi:hypothetical protein
MMYRIDDDLCFTPIINNAVASILMLIPVGKLNPGNFLWTRDKMKPEDRRSRDHRC